MENPEKTSSILRQFRKKSKRIVNKDLFTEFFYINQNRKAIELLFDEETLMLEGFLKEFLPSDFSNFVSLKLLNEDEEEIKTWFYDDENLILVIAVNWGFRKEEISIEINIENFTITSIDEKSFVVKDIDYHLLNDFLISFLTNQAKILSETYKKITPKNNRGLRKTSNFER